MKFFYTKIILFITGGLILISFLFLTIFKINIDKLPSWHLPVIFIENKIVWLDDVKAVINVMVKKNNYSKTDALNQLIIANKEQYLINKLAQRENIKPISLNDTKILENKETLILANNIANELYGWPMEKFERLVIKPLELKRGVVNWYYQKNNQAIKNSLQTLRENSDVLKLIQNDENYKYLGFIELDSIDPIIQLSLLNQQPNSISEIVETENSYNLIYLQSFLPEKNLFEVGLVSYTKKTFSDWLKDNINSVFTLSLVK